MKKEVQRKIFSKTLDWVNERIDMRRLDSTSSDLIELASGTLRQEIRDYLKKQKKEKKINDSLKAGYYDFLEKGIKNHKGITKATLSDYKKDFRKELENRIANSFALIKNKDNEIIAGLSSRFLNWVTIDSKDVRGRKTDENSLLNFLDFGKENDISEEHLKFIIKDQNNKMTASFDAILAEKNDAIACIWHNRKDKRVVGNPDGLYPHAESKAHGNHWEREGKVYILQNGWAYKKGYIKGKLYESLEDGGVGVAIGCRCYLEYIYNLEDLPEENLTKKGKEVLIA